MEGFVEHLIVSNRQLAWELAREKNGTEVPYLGGLYRKWMVERDGKTLAVASAYVSYLRSLDRDVFMRPCDEPVKEGKIVDEYSETEDFFYLLKSYLEGKCFGDVEELFNGYSKWIDEEVQCAKAEDTGINPKLLGDWRSAFRNYNRFFVEYLIPVLKKHLDEKRTKQDDERAVKLPELYLEDDFMEWMQVEEQMGEPSAQSYVSKIKGVNRRVFLKRTKGVDVFSVIGKWLHDGNGVKVMELLDKLDDLLTRRIDAKDDGEMPVSTLSDSRSALRKYIKFLQEEVVFDVEDEEELDEEATEDVVDPEAATEKFVADYERLERNFRFRLLTQNRFGKIMYPISLLKRLFALSEKMSVKFGTGNNGNYKWFNRWLDDSIAEIRVLSDKKDYILADIRDLEIDLQSKKVTMVLLSGEKVPVFTETLVPGEKEPLLVDDLRKIHIDHTPLMSQLLRENAEDLPVLRRLTEMISECACGKNINVEQKGLALIAAAMFSDAKMFLKLEGMIPGLKRELNFICKIATLKLMDAKYNLRKKK